MRKWVLPLLVLSLLGPVCGYLIVYFLGDVPSFGSIGEAQYSWVLLPFLLFPIAMLALLIVLLFSHPKKKAPLISGIVFAALEIHLILFLGLIPFLWGYDYQVDVTQEGKWIGEDFSADVRSASQDQNDYRMVYVKYTSEEKRSSFEDSLPGKAEWKTALDPQIRSYLPASLDSRIESGDYFRYFLLPENSVNGLPQRSGNHRLFLASYQKKTSLITFMEYYFFQTD
jgi:hypothetical protein